MKRWKAEAITAKQQRDRRSIGSSNKDDDNYDSNIDNIDLD